MQDNLKKYWDTVTKSPEETWWRIPNKEVIDLAKTIKPGKVLDIACGMGRHTVLLASMGFQVRAFDGSDDAVKHTRKWLEAEGLKADVQKADLASFDYKEGQYNLVLSINAFHHQREKQVRQNARNIEKSLKSGGMFIANLPAFRIKKANEEQVEPQTYIPLEGEEKGIPHFLFKREQIAEFFPELKIVKTESVYLPNSPHEHFEILAQKP